MISTKLINYFSSLNSNIDNNFKDVSSKIESESKSQSEILSEIRNDISFMKEKQTQVLSDINENIVKLLDAFSKNSKVFESLLTFQNETTHHLRNISGWSIKISIIFRNLELA